MAARSTPKLFCAFFSVVGLMILLRKLDILFAASSPEAAPFLAICNAAPIVATASGPCIFNAAKLAPNVGMTLAMSRNSTLPDLPAEANMPNAPFSLDGSIFRLSFSVYDAREISSTSALYAVATWPIVPTDLSAVDVSMPAATRKPRPFCRFSVLCPVWDDRFVNVVLSWRNC